MVKALLPESRAHLKNRMHRVLLISEILASVFASLAPDSNARNARVCSQWRDTALDAIWRAAHPGIFRSLVPTIISTELDPYGAKALVTMSLLSHKTSLRLILHVYLFTGVRHRAYCPGLEPFFDEYTARA